jgi:hypothetical protein
VADRLLCRASYADVPPRSPTRLSAVLDPNAFFAPKRPEDDMEPSTAEGSYSGLTSPDCERISPVSQAGSGRDPAVESAYDRLVMASAGVRRVGRGYQSHIATSGIADAPAPASTLKRNPNRNSNPFLSARRGAGPPPEAPRKSISVDELGALSSASVQTSTASRREDGSNTIKLMRRALKALTGGGSVSRRLSRAAA